MLWTVFFIFWTDAAIHQSIVVLTFKFWFNVLLNALIDSISMSNKIIHYIVKWMNISLRCICIVFSQIMVMIITQMNNIYKIPFCTRTHFTRYINYYYVNHFIFNEFGCMYSSWNILFCLVFMMIIWNMMLTFHLED